MTEFASAMMSVPPRVPLDAQDLLQVMPKVPDVVVHEVIECYGRVRGHCPPGDAIEIVRGPLAHSHLVGNARHNPPDVPVEVRPQRDQIGPRALLISLSLHPIVLRIAVEHEIVAPSR